MLCRYWCERNGTQFKSDHCITTATPAKETSLSAAKGLLSGIGHLQPTTHHYENLQEIGTAHPKPHQNGCSVTSAFTTSGVRPSRSARPAVYRRAEGGGVVAASMRSDGGGGGGVAIEGALMLKCGV
jgi:hypothetical protein